MTAEALCKYTMNLKQSEPQNLSSHTPKHVWCLYCTTSTGTLQLTEHTRLTYADPERAVSSRQSRLSHLCSQQVLLADLQAARRAGASEDARAGWIRTDRHPFSNGRFPGRQCCSNCKRTCCQGKKITEQNAAYKPQQPFHRMSYKSQKYVEQFIWLKLQCVFLQKQALGFLTRDSCILEIFLSRCHPQL